MNLAQHPDQALRNKLNLETSRMAWRELQTHFASGIVIAVDGKLDLIDVAVHIANDNKTLVAQWISAALLGPATDASAAAWLDQDARMWTVVVKPWILVQHEKPAIR